MQDDLAATQKSLAALIQEKGKRRRMEQGAPQALAAPQTLAENVEGTFTKSCGRGRFGFAQTTGGEEVFVLPSNCEGNALPSVGDKITFAIAAANEGKNMAERVRPSTAVAAEVEVNSADGKVKDDPYEEQPAGPPPVPRWPWMMTRAQRAAQLLGKDVEEIYHIISVIDTVEDEWLQCIRSTEEGETPSSSSSAKLRTDGGCP
mgnify:CR=1 FL=1